jgi:hypothetical protein
VRLQAQETLSATARGAVRECDVLAQVDLLQRVDLVIRHGARVR